MGDLHARRSRLLILGASGFIGSHLTRAFARSGQHEVLASVSPRSRTVYRLESLGSKKGMRTLRLDLEKVDDVIGALRAFRPTAILNASGYGGYSWQTDPRRMMRVNFRGVHAILDWIADESPDTVFIHSGSSSEYGYACEAPSEDTPLLPDSDYARSKAMASELIARYHRERGIACHNLRLYSVYGPWEDSSRLIPQLLLAALGGRLPPLSSPEISRDFVHVEDVVEAFERALEAAGPGLPPILNIASGKRVTLATLAETARRIFPKLANVEPSWNAYAPRAWDHANWYGNPALARETLGWSARMRLDDGLRYCMDWVQTCTDWQSRPALYTDFTDMDEAREWQASQA